MTRYYIHVTDLASAHGSDAQFAWSGQSPQDLARALEQTLRDATFMRRWRDAQAEPEEVSAATIETDANAHVSIEDRAQRVEMVVTTRLPHRLLAQRLNLLIGAHWTLGDVK